MSQLIKRLLIIVAIISQFSLLPARIILGDTELTRIVVSSDAPDTTQLAARELQSFVERVSGDHLEISSEPANSGNIFLGENQALLSEVPAEGFRLKASQGNLHIAGRGSSGAIFGIRDPWERGEVYNEELKLGEFGEAGALYGVYRFLEKYAGLRFIWPGELGTVIPKQDIIVPAELDFTDYPESGNRNPLCCYFQSSPEDALWYRRAGFGGLAPIQIIHSFGNFVSAFQAEHPEYLALVDGKRDTGTLCCSQGGGHLCLTAPGVAEAVANFIIRYFELYPEQHIFPMVPNDGLEKCCECDSCLAEQDWDRPYVGRFSNHIWSFIDRVAALVAEKYPDRYIGGLAYESYQEPPDRVTRLHPNVVIMFCKNRGCTASPVYEKAMRDRVAKWQQKLSGKIYNWDYYLYTWLPWRGLPICFPHLIQKDLKYMHENGFDGEFICSESWIPSTPTSGYKINFPGTQHLHLYLTGKLLWHADLDLEELLADYYSKFYGEAAEPMRKFTDLAEQCWMNGFAGYEETDGIFPHNHPRDIFSAQNIQTLLSLLDQALAMVPEDSDYHKRIMVMKEECTAGFNSLNIMINNRTAEMDVLPTGNNTITVDGRLDEATWQDGDFAEMSSNNGEKTPYETRIKARHDEANLYFSFILTESKTDCLHLEAKVHDDPVMYMDDCVEIFLMDQDESGNGHQFIINAAGLIWDGLRHADSRVDDTWNSTARAVTTITPGKEIIIEFAVPMAELSIKPELPITANFYRSHVADETQRFATWSITFEETHFMPGKFGLLHLK